MSVTGDVTDFVARLPSCELALPGDLQTTDREAAEKTAAASAKAAEEYEALLVAAKNAMAAPNAAFAPATPALGAAGSSVWLPRVGDLGSWDY